MGTDGPLHRYCRYASRLLMIFLTDTVGTPHLTGTGDLPHRHCGYIAWVQLIFLVGTAGMPHGYF